MANLADKSGDAYSNIVQGKGTPSLAFPMPGTVPLDVESVVATIDNAAGGDTTPTLVVRDSSGEVIATKRMGDVIPAGDTGTATFSLRNADSGGVGIRYNVANSGGYLRVAATGASPVAYEVGDDISNWSVGIGGDVVAIGAAVNMFVSAKDLTQIRGTGQVEVLSDGPFSVFADNSTQGYGSFVNVNVGDSYALQVTNDVSISGSGQELDMQATEVAVRLSAGAALTVYDHSNNPIFRVNEDGSLQGKTGKALTFNL